MGDRRPLLHVFEAAVKGSKVAAREPNAPTLEAAWWDAPALDALPFSVLQDREILREFLRRPPPSPPAKLVRDRIPDIMAAAGTSGLFRLAAPSERRALLLAKVREEAAEVVASGGSVEKVADLVEVLAALQPGHELRRARRAKRKDRGAFRRGYVLMPG